MAFALSPRDYLNLVQDQHVDFKADATSLRKAIALSMLANHICEHVFAACITTTASKLDGCKDVASYRQHLQRLEPELLLIRDLCDFAKHGPRLDRKSVQVSKAETKGTMVADFSGLLLGLMNHHEEVKIVVTLDNGGERHFDYLINEVMLFWASLFTTKGL